MKKQFFALTIILFFIAGFANAQNSGGHWSLSKKSPFYEHPSNGDYWKSKFNFTNPELDRYQGQKSGRDGELYVATVRFSTMPTEIFPNQTVKMRVGIETIKLENKDKFSATGSGSIYYSFTSESNPEKASYSTPEGEAWANTSESKLEALSEMYFKAPASGTPYLHIKLYCQHPADGERYYTYTWVK